MAGLTAHGFEGWQVGNRAQVESLLAQVWLIEPTNGHEVWEDWTPIEHPLEFLVSEIPYHVSRHGHRPVGSHAQG